MAVDYFLKLDTIEGESADSNFANQIQLMSFSWGASQISSVAGTGGSGAGKASLTEFNVNCYFDKSTPLLFKSLCAGTHLATGEMNAVKSGAEGKPYLKVDFKEIFITNISISAGGEIPSVTISFSYNEIKIDYSTQAEGGTIASTGAVTFNTKTNTLS